MRLTGVSEIELIGYESKNLDTVCYRGSAPLAHLALISQTDVFDQVTNRDGLQRDLSPKPRKRGLRLCKREVRHSQPRAFPEVVLNVRDKSILQNVKNGEGCECVSTQGV